MPQALPYLIGAQAVVSLINQLNPPRPPSAPQIPTVSYDEAVQRAQQAKSRFDTSSRTSCDVVSSVSFRERH